MLQGWWGLWVLPSPRTPIHSPTRPPICIFISGRPTQRLTGHTEEAWSLVKTMRIWEGSSDAFEDKRISKLHLQPSGKGHSLGSKTLCKWPSSCRANNPPQPTKQRLGLLPPDWHNYSFAHSDIFFEANSLVPTHIGGTWTHRGLWPQLVGRDAAFGLGWQRGTGVDGLRCDSLVRGSKALDHSWVPFWGWVRSHRFTVTVVSFFRGLSWVFTGVQSFDS